ncbi:hypothetical protein E2562_036701 [Oryza meyeriana var. granulata]|uniref:Uncharacterized protein n=1 Tax=Oryza meyeriana var. granulata TaxID=110450 RepID=A0A6G1CL33_9ORYZ|nr:hypothetical protein E2562_036701 [Oryza meyeriana var. granulata]
MDAHEASMAFILGHSYVKAKSVSSFFRWLVINFAFGYDILTSGRAYVNGEKEKLSYALCRANMGVQN